MTTESTTNDHQWPQNDHRMTIEWPPFPNFQITMLRPTKSPQPKTVQTQKSVSKKPGKLQPVSFTEDAEQPAEFISDMDKSLTAAIGLLNPNVNTHFYSFGNFNLVRLIMYIIKQTGPVNLCMTSYSFSNKSIQQLQRHIETAGINHPKVRLLQAEMALYQA